MTRRPMLRSGLALAGVLVAACGTSLPSPSPLPSPTATVDPGPAEVVLGCVSIEAAECQFVAEHISAALPLARGRPFAIEISLFGCPAPGAPCPRSLAVRQGRAVVEYLDGGEPIELALTGPPQAPRISPQDAFFSGLIQPASQRVGGPGPFPFELGHCGLSHVVDFDGSFWLPVGQVDGDASGMINSESGQMRLVAANVAIYQGPGGFSAQLARFPGPKRFYLCD